MDIYDDENGEFEHVKKIIQFKHSIVYLQGLAVPTKTRPFPMAMSVALALTSHFEFDS